MNKSVLLLCIFIFLSFLYSCSKTSSENTSNDQVISNPEYGIWQDLEVPPFEFELVQTFGAEVAPEDEILGTITAMLTDKNQNLYVLDNRLSKLLSFDKTGELRWTAGSKGRGPSDFENAWNMIWDGNQTIYVSNIARSRIDLFNLKGEFLHTLSINNEKLKSVSLHGFINDKLVVSKTISGSFAKEFMFIKPENPDSVLTSFSVDLTGELKVPQGISWFSNVSVLEDQLVVAGMSDYSYTFYDFDSTKIKQVNRDFNNIIRPGFFQNDNGRSIGSMGGLNPLLKAGNGFYISTAGWPTNVKDPDQYMKDLNMGKDRRAIYRNTTDLFDENFKLLYSIESDEFINDQLGLMIHTDNEGHLYSINYTTYPHIKKYRLVVND